MLPLGPWKFVLRVAGVAAIAFLATLWWTSGKSRPPAGDPSWPDTVFSSVSAPARALGSQPDADGRFSCTVAFVNDGDTLRCEDGTRVRLHAVSARERDGSCSPGHPCPAASAEAATSTLRRLVGARTIRCQPTGRSYGRVTAICWTLGGEEVNCAMVRSGVALIWERFDRQAPLCRARRD